MGAGAFRSWGEIERFVAVSDTVEPDPRAHIAYADIYSAYRELYPALRPLALGRAGAQPAA